MTEARPFRNRVFRRQGALVAVGAAAFAAGLIAFAPASLIGPAIAAAGGDVAIERIEGSLWRGVVRSAVIDGIDLGDVHYSVRPAGLLRGLISLDISADGAAAKGAGRIALGLDGRTVRIEGLSGRFDLASIRRYRLLGMPFEGSLDFDVARIEWRRGDGCIEAAGDLRTDALSAQMQRVIGADADLQGPISCTGEDISVDLAGENEMGSARVLVSLDPDRNYSLTASVRPTARSVSDALELIGFRRDDDGLVYDVYGPLKGIGL